MLDLIGSWMLSIWPYSLEPQTLQTMSLETWVQKSHLAILGEPPLVADPEAIAAVQNHLTALVNRGFAAEQQGIWIQSGYTVLAEHEGTTPLPAASLTKIPTTLVALKTWGANHQFETQVHYRGRVENGVLQGDLIIAGEGDPFFVWEEAIALSNTLREAGITSVEGDLVIAGNFSMNFKDDPLTAGTLLRQGMNATLWPSEAQAQYETLPPGTPRPSLTITGRVRTISLNDLRTLPTTAVVSHRSVPLIEMLKQMNIYSNNFMAEKLAQELGGAAVVARQAAAIAHVPEAEIQMVNGSGLGEENQISARAVCSMLMAVQTLLGESAWTIADVFPVSGLDVGTIQNRDIPANAAVKTGTLATVSSLAGVLPVDDQEIVWFAIINRGWDLDNLRNQQDRLLHALVKAPLSGTTIPASITRQPNTFNPEAQLGSPQRNHSLSES